MMSRKKILTIASVFCMSALAAGVTLAYFTDTDEVTNRFVTQGSFDIQILEKESDDGTFVDEDDPSGGIEYKNFLPGQRLQKEPFVKNEGSYDEWVRVKVIVPRWSVWKNAFERHGIPNVGPETFSEKVLCEYNTEDWERSGYIEDASNDTLIIKFYLKSKLEPKKESSCVFHYVKIPPEFDAEDLKEDVLGKFDIKLVAEALQADNTGTNAIEAFELFYDEQKP